MSTEKEPEIIADGPRQDDYKPISKIEEPLETQAKEFIIGETIILSEASDSSNRAGFDHEIAMASDTHVRSEPEPNLHIPSMKIFSVNDASRNANFSGENQGTTQPKQEDELEKDADSSCHDFSSSSDEPEGKNIGILESEAGAGPFDSSITFVTESETTNSSPKLTKVRSRKLFENLDDLSDALISRDKQRPEGQPVIGSHVNPVVVQEADSAFDEHSPSHRNDIWENEQWQNLPPTDIEAEGHFVEVSLHDPPRILGHPPRVRVSRDSIGSSPFQHSANISPKSASSRRLSFSSFDGGSSFASPLDSPLYQRREPLMPNAPPILMHLIDSAIQGADPSSLQRLRKVVAGEETLQQEAGDIEDWEDVAMLVVDILVAKMGGVDGLDERTETSTPRMMLGAGSAVVAGDLIPWLPSKGDSESEISPRTKMAKCLTLILQACTRNRAMCSAAGLLQVLLQAVRIILSRKMEGAVKLEAWDFNPLLDAIESLSSHCLSVLDLREWLNAISDSDAAGKSMDLILSLERAMSGEETRGPTYTFEFDGESSGLLGPGESKWPFVSGYAFATWLYIESFADTLHTAAAAAAVVAAAAAKSGRSSAISAAAAASALAGEGTAHMPRLFSFLSADNHGVEAYFHGQFLVVESASGKGKKASLHFTHAFKPRRWYFVGLEHTFKQTLIGKAESEFRLYVDGHLYETRPLEFPRVSKGLAFCCIGTNPPPTMAGLQRRRRQCPLFAEMGPIYIFREPIGQDKMARLATRGGNFLPTFGAGAGIPGLAANDQAMLFAEEGVALDSEIGPQLHLLYHPKLLVGRSCMDASPLGASGVHRRHAEVLGHVHVAARTHPTDALWAMADGGPLALLPLIVDNVDRNSLQPVLEDPNIPSAASSLSAATFRILSLALQHHGNAEEMLRYSAPQLLAHLLGKIVCAPSSGVLERTSSGKLRIEERDEELVAAVVSLCQAPKHNAALKVQLYSCLLLDLKLWCRCAYGLQKKLLSSLSDMVFTEELTMRALNAVQLLLDGCRRCYWVIPEAHSIHMFPGDRSSRHIGEINALVDELLIIIELMMGSAHDTTAAADVSCLVQFVLDCPQPNQVARVLHLLYRLVVQPNASRSSMFAELLVTNGGLEMLLALLQRESQMVDSIASVQSFTTESKLERGQDDKDEPSISTASSNSGELNTIAHGEENPVVANCNGKEESQQKSVSLTSKMIGGEHTVEESSIRSFTKLVSSVRSSAGRLYADRKIGGISLSISADSARNNFRNIDSGDGIMVGVVSLLGALVAGGHVKLSTLASSIIPQFGASSTTTIGELNPGSSIGAWILYALQKAFQAAPNRLLTDNVYTALLAAVTRSEGGTLSSEDRLAFFASGHRLEHCQLLLALLRSLPYASRTMQLRALQDILLLASMNPENRTTLTAMTEWPEWLLEILISNYEAGSSKLPGGFAGFQDIEDLVYSFLTIMLEHSMRMKDGWKDVEAAIHCAEWLAILGGSSIGEQRMRREESLPAIKRRLLGSLLDFAAGELQKQSEVVAAVAAGVAAENLSPKAAKAEAEAAAHMSMSLSENALVLLMLVEDHLRLQSQSHNSCLSSAAVSVGSMSPASALTPSGSSLGRRSVDGGESFASRRFSNTMETSGLSLEVLSSMADVNGQLSAASIERLSASAAAEPYESVRCAFASYGSSGVDLAEGWKRRSRMWHGVGLPSEGSMLAGGGGGWESWKSVVEEGDNGDWVDLPLVKKSVAMLQALLLDDSGPGGGGGMGFGGGAGTGESGLQALQQLLDSDQPFFAMLRMVLLASREEDQGDSQVDGSEHSTLSLKGMHWRSLSSDNIGKLWSQPKMPNDAKGLAARTHSALLWCILAPLLTMPISESRRQRVLVAACILYSEVWNAVTADRKIVRKQHVETIIPPFTALLRRWRPLLSGMHELTDADGQSPLAVEDRALATDAFPSEVALAMTSPAWAAAFASPPAAMALAMAAAGVGGGEMPASKGSNGKREAPNVERKALSLRSFSNFLKYSDPPPKSSPVPKDKAAAKAAALAAAREQERVAKIGSGRGLGAVAMASSAQRRAITDRERAKRWNISEAMNMVWVEIFSSKENLRTEALEKEISELGSKSVLCLSTMAESARRRLSDELDRRTVAAAADEFHSALGARTWCSLIRRLLEVEALFGEMERQLSSSQVFWKLDFIENSIRMRRRLKRNYKGTDHYGAAADHRDAKDENEEFTSGTTERASDISQSDVPLPAGAPKLAPEHAGVEDLAEEETSRSEYGELEDRTDLKGSPFATKAQSPRNFLATECSGTGYEGTRVSFSNKSTVTTAIIIDATERIFLEIPAAMIQPLRIMKGRLQVTSKRLRFIRDDQVLIEVSDGELAEINPHKEMFKQKTWPLSGLVEVHSRRYLLRKSALELFMVDRSNAFFTFGTAEARSKVYKALIQAHPPHLNTIFAGTQRPERLLKRTQLMEKWAHHEITNFEYLMQLNTLAGRTYNDITQYPVFPWILADYTSEVLNLDDPKSYRDLSKPVGALNQSRLAQVLERYHNFDDPVIPKFHYGSHYSSAGTVLYYLVRIEPYTTLAIQLQGGKFDHADRMFGDLSSTWNGVLEDMSDVKELVPELFYLPEILTNSNGFDLGRTQTGESLGDVKLPAWANDSVDFVQKHRAALESEYVSAHLHEWIDLIFGYKQRGKEAMDASNVFFYMTYEGTVDIDKIVDPVLRKATQDQIAYFGQTPSQLLTFPHIKRKPLNDILHLHTIFQHPKSTRIFPVSNSDRCNVPAGKLAATQDSIVFVDKNAPACRVAVHKWKPNTPDGQGMPFLFQYGKAITNSGSGAIMRMFRNPSTGTDDYYYPRASAWTAQGIKSEDVVVVSTDGKLLLTGGHADNSIKVVSTENARVSESAFGHSAPITCVALSAEGSMLVTGSRDTTAIIWRLKRNANTTTSTRKSISDSASPSSAAAATETMETTSSIEGKKRHIEGPLHILRGHVDEITCCCISLDLDLVVTFSFKTGILLHSITKGRLIRRILITRVDIMALSSEGIILTWDKGSHTLKTFTVNGIANGELVLPSSDGNVTAVSISADGLNFVIGTNGVCSSQDSEQDTSSGSLSQKGQKFQNSVGNTECNLTTKTSEAVNKDEKEPEETINDSSEYSLTSDSSPSVILLNLYSLKILHRFRLQQGQNVTAIALNQDNTNLIVSTTDRQLLVFADPALSIKIVNQMLVLAGEANGLASYLT